MNRIIETYTTSLGYDIRIVGGAVRDLLQNKTPKDIDFATTALPDQIIELCQQNNVRHYLTGLKMYLEYLTVLILVVYKPPLANKILKNITKTRI